MKITDVWRLHLQNFLIQIEGSDSEAKEFLELLKKTFKDKTFLIMIKNDKNK